MQLAEWGIYKFNADATKCADEIMEICETLESATPQQILEKAKDESSELHKCFTWDDTKAAEKWRLFQARQVVCNLKIKIIEHEAPKVTPLRVFYKTDNISGYKPTRLIIKKEDEYEALVRRCQNELMAIKQKFQNVHEYDEIWKLIN